MLRMEALRPFAHHLTAVGLAFLVAWALACLFLNALRTNRPAGDTFMLGVPLIVAGVFATVGVYVLVNG